MDLFDSVVWCEWLVVSNNFILGDWYVETLKRIISSLPLFQFQVWEIIQSLSGAISLSLALSFACQSNYRQSFRSHHLTNSHNTQISVFKSIPLPSPPISPPPPQTQPPFIMLETIQLYSCETTASKCFKCLMIMGKMKWGNVNVLLLNFHLRSNWIASIHCLYPATPVTWTQPLVCDYTRALCACCRNTQ